MNSIRKYLNKPFSSYLLSNQLNEINNNKHHKMLQIANTFIDQIVIVEIDSMLYVRECCV